MPTVTRFDSATGRATLLRWNILLLMSNTDDDDDDDDDDGEFMSLNSTVTHT